MALLQPRVRKSLAEQTGNKPKCSAFAPAETPVPARGEGAGGTAVSSSRSAGRSASPRAWSCVSACARDGQEQRKKEF